MSAFWVLDRFEDGDWAVLESDDGDSARVPASWLPAAASEGSVLRIDSGVEGGLREDPKSQSLRLVVDEAETERRRGRIEEIHKKLPRGPEGDIEL